MALAHGPAALQVFARHEAGGPPTAGTASSGASQIERLRGWDAKRPEKQVSELLERITLTKSYWPASAAKLQNASNQRS